VHELVGQRLPGRARVHVSLELVLVFADLRDLDVGLLEERAQVVH
jgi:hypothetical protein